jgi:hypothetical protein
MKIETQLSKRTVQHSLYQEGYNRRVVKKKIRIREVNRKKRVKWAREKLHSMMKILTFCPNIADDRFISGLILKIEGLKIHCHKIDVYLFPRVKYNSVIYGRETHKG